MSVVTSLTKRTRVEVTVSDIGVVDITVTRNGQTIEHLNYGREQDLNPTFRLELDKARGGVNVYDVGPDGERLLRTIAVAAADTIPLDDLPPAEPEPEPEPEPVAEEPAPADAPVIGE